MPCFDLIGKTQKVIFEQSGPFTQILYITYYISCSLKPDQRATVTFVSLSTNPSSPCLMTLIMRSERSVSCWRRGGGGRGGGGGEEGRGRGERGGGERGEGRS